MYRLYLTILLCACAAKGLRDSSRITYIKLQPLTKPVHDAYPRTNLRESRIKHLPLLIRYDNAVVSRHVRSDEEPPVTSTEADLETTTYQPVSEDLKPEARFYSKLSYFHKNDYESPLSTNFVDTRPEKRRFKSRCRCEKIWNCPKLQITVPRCPDEYFMCCF